MFTLSQTTADSKPELYAGLAAQARALLAGEHDLIANTANLASLIFHTLPDLNWAGFYVVRGNELVLGPFQGKPACIRIAMGRGVCGTAAAERRTLVVPDVEAFPGHIACDSASRSELVAPVIVGGRLVAVLDLDSPIPARFDDDDRAGVEALVEVLVETMADVDREPGR